MFKRFVWSLLFFVFFCGDVKEAAAITDYAVNLIDKGTEYVEQVGQVQEDITSQVSEYMNVKIGIPGDAKKIQKATEKAQRIKEKADKYQAKVEKLEKKAAKAKEKAAAIKAEKDKLKAKADKIKAQYQKAKAKIDEVKSKVDEVKGEIDKAKQQYEDIKNKVDEVKDGINDIKEGAEALKDVAEAKLDEVKDKIPGQEEEIVDETTEDGELKESDVESEEKTEMSEQEAEPEVNKAEPEVNKAKLTKPKADTLSAIHRVLQKNDIQMAVNPTVVTPEAVVMPQMVTPEEVLKGAENVKLNTPEKVEYSSEYDLQEQLKMLDAAKAQELSENTPKHISDEEFRGQLKAGDEAKLEALRAGRAISHKSFVQPQDKPKGDVDVR